MPVGEKNLAGALALSSPFLAGGCIVNGIPVHISSPVYLIEASGVFRLSNDLAIFPRLSLLEGANLDFSSPGWLPLFFTPRRTSYLSASERS